MGYVSPDVSGLGFSLKPPRLVRNIFKRGASGVERLERIQERGFPVRVGVEQREPFKIGGMPVWILVGAVALLALGGGGALLGRRRRPRRRR